MSPSFSGSTLLTTVLGQHREIATIGELKASAMGDVDTYLCSCGERLVECEFWSVVGAGIKKHVPDFTFKKFGTHFRSSNKLFDRILRTNCRGPLAEWIRRMIIEFNPAFNSEYQDILSRNKLLIDRICGLVKRPVFLDASKDPNRLLYLSRSDLFEIYPIALYRDGRGVCNSMRKHDGLSVEEAATLWKRKIVEMKNVLQMIRPTDAFILRYEEFCHDPDGAVDRIVNKVGLTDDHHAQLSDDMHILGNSMRVSNTKEIRLDEKWKQELSSDEKSFFDGEYGELNRSLGYSQ
jgi:hypothetical protein